MKPEATEPPATEGATERAGDVAAIFPKRHRRRPGPR